MAEVLATHSETRVRPAIVETVDAVTACCEVSQQHDDDTGWIRPHDYQATATVNEVATHLRLDRSAALRRLHAAEDAGFVVNVEERRGRPSRYRLTGVVVPDSEMLPTPAALRDALQHRG
jgi:hypothetical protein